MPPGDDLVRVHIRISRELQQKMHIIPWGIRRNLLEVVLELVLNAVDEGGIVVAGAILDRKFKLVRSEVESVPILDGGIS